MISANGLRGVGANGVKKHTFGTPLENEGVDTHRRIPPASLIIWKERQAMPIATNIERLTPGPTPPGPPWRNLTTCEFVRWMGRTPQSAYNWAFLGSGPPRTMGRNRRGAYRLAEVEHWIEGDGSSSADHRIRAFLAQHMRFAMCATGLMRPGAGAGVRRALAGLDRLSSTELEAVCDALDKVRTPWPKAKAAGGQP